MKEDHFSVDVALLSYDDALRGEEISSCISSLENPRSTRMLLDIMSGLAVDAMNGYRSVNGSYMPITSAILYHGGMAIVSPKKLDDIEDKMSFYRCLSKLSSDISEKMNDRPILVSISSEVWSCCIRKSLESDVIRAARSLGIMVDDDELKSELINQAVSQYGSISDIPDDHPYVKKFDMMLFLSGFLTMDGPKYVSKLSKISDSSFFDVDETRLPKLDLYNVENYLVGNIKFDVSDYDCVAYSPSYMM